jgi:hypothetical protein
MIALLLIALATLGQEASDTLGKKAMGSGWQTIYTAGFLGLFWGLIFLAVSAAAGFSPLHIAAASLPTLSVRVMLEITLAIITMTALSKADRSTFGFFRLLTIPLLLVVDVVLGYNISGWQMAGIAILFGALIGALGRRTLNQRGIVWVLISALLAVVTISLYKYDITHYNSVAAEQLIVFGSILLTFFLIDLARGQNPAPFLKSRFGQAQSLTTGLGTVLESYAYVFAPASIIMSGKRSFAVLWSILAGRRFFAETGLGGKVITLGLVIIGLILLTKTG